MSEPELEKHEMYLDLEPQLGAPVGIQIRFLFFFVVRPLTRYLHPMTYKHALELYSKYNSKEMRDDWVDLNLQQNFNGRLQIVDKSRIRVGKNILTNRPSLIRNKINYS